MTDKIYIKWDEFHQHTKNLCQKIKASGEYDKIVAISRGGLLPAGIIAYELNIRNVGVVNMSTYDGDARRRQEDFEFQSAGVGKIDEHTLIVDDLSDTGNTYNLLRPLFPGACFVTVYVKPAGQKVVDVFAREMPDNWIVFPWD